MTEKSITRIIQYEIPLGDWVLKLSKLAGEEFVHFSLHWKGRDTAKHAGKISQESFQYIINDLLDLDEPTAYEVHDDDE